MTLEREDKSEMRDKKRGNSDEIRDERETDLRWEMGAERMTEFRQNWDCIGITELRQKAGQN